MKKVQLLGLLFVLNSSFAFAEISEKCFDNYEFVVNGKGFFLRQKNKLTPLKPLSESSYGIIKMVVPESLDQGNIWYIDNVPKSGKILIFQEIFGPAGSETAYYVIDNPRINPVSKKKGFCE